MSVPLKESQTLQNLMRAFSGESQARNRYTFAAALCRTQKLHVLDAVFTFTANQEKEHGEIFYNHMKEAAGEKISIQADYPVDLTNDVCELLRRAEAHEREECSPVYPDFADAAQKEGFPEIAGSFRQIAQIEQAHANRFARFRELMEQGQLFVSDVQCGWLCLNCGHIHNGLEAPKICPVCSHPQGFFLRLEMAPYGGNGVLVR